MDLDYKKVVMACWEKGLKAGLDVVTEATDNKWDDAATEVVDRLVQRFFGEEE